MNIRAISLQLTTLFAFILAACQPAPTTTPVIPTLTKPAQTASPPPHKQQILFLSSKDKATILYRINDDGSDLTQLTEWPGDATNLIWSPNGDQIAFIEDGQLHLAKADGSMQRQFKNLLPNDRASFIAWSPKGNQIALITTCGLCSNLYIIDTTNELQTPIAGSELKRPDSGYWMGQVSWSPDGNSIVYDHQQAEIYPNQGGVRLQNIHTGEKHYLLGENGGGGLPVWSPDGKQIAFAFSQNNADLNLYSSNVDGNNLRRMGNTPNVARDFVWSPNGRKIVFISTDNQTSQIYVVNADGSNQTVLVNYPAYNACPSWSPDGQKIAFISNQDGHFQIYLMDADGSNPVKLTDHPYDKSCPQWRPKTKR